MRLPDQLPVNLSVFVCTSSRGTATVTGPTSVCTVLGVAPSLCGGARMM